MPCYVMGFVMEIDIDKLKRRLKRLRARESLLAAKHGGNEQNYTYHAGFDIGYLKGVISEIENTIDELEST